MGNGWVVIDGEMQSKVDRTMVKAVAKAHCWFEDLISGAVTTAEIARRENITPGYVGRLMRLAFLSPEIVKTIIDGRQPAALSAETLVNKIDIPCAWSDQKSCFSRN